MNITNTHELREAIRTPYAWPGGYPTMIVMHDGEYLCHQCARENYRELSINVRDPSDFCWRPVALDVNWESELYCSHCRKQIESAYPPSTDQEPTMKDPRQPEPAYMWHCGHMTPKEMIYAVQAAADAGGYSTAAISWVAADKDGTLTRVDSQPELGFMVVDNYYCSVVFTINNGVITPVYANGMVR